LNRIASVSFCLVVVVCHGQSGVGAVESNHLSGPPPQVLGGQEGWEGGTREDVADRMPDWRT